MILLSRLPYFLIFFFLSIPLLFAQEVSLLVVDSNEKPVQGAVIWAPGLGKTEPKEVKIIQKNRQFHPEVTIIPVGSTISFPNRDTVQHHVYSFSSIKKIDIPLYFGESPQKIKFEQRGIVPIGCNIHDWMSAFIVVVDTPFVAESEKNGIAELKGIKTGQLLQVWHPRLKGNPLEIKASSQQKVVLSLRPAVNRLPRVSPSGGY